VLSARKNTCNYINKDIQILKSVRFAENNISAIRENGNGKKPVLQNVQQFCEHVIWHTHEDMKDGNCPAANLSHLEGDSGGGA